MRICYNHGTRGCRITANIPDFQSGAWSSTLHIRTNIYSFVTPDTHPIILLYSLTPLSGLLLLATVI